MIKIILIKSTYIKKLFKNKYYNIKILFRNYNKSSISLNSEKYLLNLEFLYFVGILYFYFILLEITSNVS